MVDEVGVGAEHAARQPVVAHRRARHPARGANRLVAQAECQAEAQHLLDLSHLRPLPRHPFLPAKPVAEQDGMRRSQRSDTAALNPQLWRIGPKQGWRNRRNRGRIGPKQGGGLDRNHRRFEPKYAANSEKRPSSTALSSALEPQKAVPSCRMRLGAIGVMWVMAEPLLRGTRL